MEMCALHATKKKQENNLFLQVIWLINISIKQNNKKCRKIHTQTKQKTTN